MTHREFSRKGGRAGKGAAKARTSAQARAAILARWSKRKKTKKTNVSAQVCEREKEKTNE